MPFVNEEREYSFRELARPWFRCDDPPEWFAMFAECYFDDSSDEKHERYFAYGGLIGSPEQWDAFQILWGIETKKLKEPFHSADCDAGRGQFSGWSKEERFELMARLTTVVRQIRLFGFASILPVSDFKSVFPSLGERDAVQTVVAHVVVNIARLASRTAKDFALFFEQGNHNGWTINIFDRLRKCGWDPINHVRGPAFENKQYQPMQAADLVAREAFKHIDNLGVRDQRKALTAISETMFFMQWTVGTLAHFSKKGGPAKLNALWESMDLADSEKLLHFYWNQEWRKKHGEANSVQSISGNDGLLAEGFSRGNQGQARGRETGKKAEEI